MAMELGVSPAGRLRGRVRVPGDKSISHRAALIGALARGDTVIHDFLRAYDCLHTVSCLRALGVGIEDEGSRLIVRGMGPRWRAPMTPLDAGNSGTTMRLLAGILAGQPFQTELTGDASLRTRPVDRIVEPLSRMGARIVASGDGRFPPLRITGGSLRGITHTLPVASAQVKSAVLLAGLLAGGPPTGVGATPTPDHTERMLGGFGAPLRRERGPVTVSG